MRASDAWIEKLAMFISRRSRSVPLIRCLPKMSPSSSTSTVSQIATWRRSLTRTRRREFSFDLQSLLTTGNMFVWLMPAFLTEPGSARYSSVPSITTVWYNYQNITTSLKSISQQLWLYHQLFKMVFSPVQLSQCQSRNLSFFVLIGQIAFSWYTVMINHKYVNVQTSVVDLQWNQ